MDNEHKISKLCDLYSLGAILYRCLLGDTPDTQIAAQITKNNLHTKLPSENIYNLPFFAKKKIMSNEMCYILVKLLSENPKHRYTDLNEIKQALLKLRKDIFETPRIMRELLKHPILPGETLDSINPKELIDFRNKDMNKFSLKYLAKFICEHNLEKICINGGPMPFNSIQTDSLTELNLSDSGLYS